MAVDGSAGGGTPQGAPGGARGQREVSAACRPEPDLARVRLWALLVFLVLTTLLAWHSDDAYHIYVMARNLAEGHGLVYNLGERVNASTTPLFTLVVALLYRVSGSMFGSGLAAGILFSGLTAYLLIYRMCRSVTAVLASVTCLLVSGSFVAYTTSGLENPLLFFLATVFMVGYSTAERYSPRQLLVMALALGLLATARMDAVLVLASAFAWALLRRRQEGVSLARAGGLVLLGMAPFLCWEMFSLFYYGFPLPNTAYAKLGTALPWSGYLVRGLSYFVACGLSDLAALCVPALFMVQAAGSRNLKYALVAVGVALYLAYVLCIGGDFMLGRFLALPLLVSVLGLQGLYDRSEGSLPQSAFLAAVSLAIVFNCSVAAVISGHFLYHGDRTILYSSHTADERAFYFPNTSLVFNLASRWGGGPSLVDRQWAADDFERCLREGRKAAVVPFAAGILAYRYVPRLHVVDPQGLGDPLLTKLPAEVDAEWRVGHAWRAIPQGYVETLESGQNCLVDPSLHEYYDRLALVTRGDLLDPERLRTIVDLNLGRYDHLVREYAASRR